MAKLNLSPTHEIELNLPGSGGALSLALQPMARGVPGIEGDKGDKGDTGDAGPAPAGTGYVKVVDGALQVPSPTIPSTDITQDITHRFVTDTEKAAWDAVPGSNKQVIVNVNGALVGTANFTWDEATNTLHLRKIAAPEADKGYLNLGSDNTVTLGNSTGERIAFTGGYPVWLKQGEGQLALGASNSLTIGADSDGVLGVKGNNFSGYADAKMRTLIVETASDGGVSAGAGLYFGSKATNKQAIIGFNGSMYHRVEGANALLMQYAFNGGGAALIMQLDGNIGVIGFNYGNVPNGGISEGLGSNAVGRLEVNNGRTTGTGGELRDLKARTFFGEALAYNQPAYRVMSGASYLGGLGSNGSMVQLRHEATGNLLSIGNTAQVDAKGLKVVAGTTTTAQPALEVTQTWNNAAVTQDAFVIDVTSTAAENNSNIFNFKKNSTTVLRLDQWGSLYPAASNAGTVGYRLDQTGLALKTQFGITWSAGTTATGTRHIGFFPSDWVTGQVDVTAGSDVRWSGGAYRDVALRTLYSYNLLTNLTNYERAKFGWTSDTLEIGVQNAGTGTARGISLLAPGGVTIVATSGGSGAYAFHPNQGFASFGQPGAAYLEIGSNSWRGMSRIINLTSTSGISWSSTTNVAGAAALGLSQEGTAGKLAVTDGASSPAYRDVILRGLQFGAMLTVGTLPSASTSEGLIYRVSDALAPTVGATVAAGGSAKAFVIASSSAWIVIIVA